MKDEINVDTLEQILGSDKKKLKHMLNISINDFKEYLKFCEDICSKERYNLIHKHNIKLKNIGFNEIFLFFKNIEEQINRNVPVSKEQIKKARFYLNTSIEKTEAYIKLNF